MRRTPQRSRRDLLGLICTSIAVGTAGLPGPAGAHLVPQPRGVAPASGSLRAGLVDHHGKPFELPRLAGRPALLTFGFTRCSSTCPVSMQHAADLAGRIGPRKLQVVFVSLDPLSDSPAQLSHYLSAFSPEFLGVTGHPSAIDALSERFRVGIQRGGTEGLAHSSMWYLLDEQVNVRAVARYDATADDLANLLSRASVSVR